MPSYVTLWNWTENGIRDVRQTMARVDAVKAEFERRGVSIDVRWTVGPYDGIALIEAPDDESATAALYWLGSAGNVRTTTMRTFGTDEMARILDKVG
jgi:uncharacterized protein with GYD domain